MTATWTDIDTTAALHKKAGRSQLARRTMGARLMRAIGLIGQRRALAGLEPHMLADIGVSRAQAHREARRPFWDAPAHWRHRA